MVVLGNPKVLSKQPLWNNLLVHFKDNDCLVEGPLNNLKQSMVREGVGGCLCLCVYGCG